MTTTTRDSVDKAPKPEELPFAAPCKTLETTAALRWLKLGWQDIKSAPKQSLTYGVILFFIIVLQEQSSMYYFLYITINV